MKSFNLFIPTQIIFGSGRINKIATYMPKKSENVLLVTDRTAAEKSGAGGVIAKKLSHLNIHIFDQVEENPSFATLIKGSQLAREFKCDMIIGLGGGSPMDAAKGIAILTTNNMTIQEVLKGHPLKMDPLPISCIPTTSGTGSEVTPYAVFTDTDNQNKCGYGNNKIFPRFSIIDPQLTFSMPSGLIVNTGPRNGKRP